MIVEDFRRLVAMREEITAKVEARQERMEANMNAWLEGNKAYPEKREANAEEMESVAEHPEVPKEEAEVKTFGALKKWYRDRQLDVGRRRQLQKRTHGDSGSRKKLDVARRGMTLRAGAAGRKVRGHV
jgi:hypothetical protein